MLKRSRMKSTAVFVSTSMLAVTASLSPVQAWGQQATSPPSPNEAPAQSGAPAGLPTDAPGGDIVVTATRRATDVTSIPYNITAIGAEQVQKTGATSVEDLSRQIPNLVTTSPGNQFLGAQRQIMRGLNASNSNRLGVTLEQNPVSTYLGNAPFANYFQINDLDHVEVLRGPQGTLYGAGTLGGAIRLIPAEPKLGRFEGKVSATGGFIAHSGDHDYGADGIVNVPLGANAALRLSVSHDYTGGFIDTFGVFERANNDPLGTPVLVDPANPVTSAARTYSIRDANHSEATNVRLAARWKPIDALDVTIAYNRSRVNGFGPNYDSPSYNGGGDPFAPGTIYPDTDEFEVVQRAVQPFERQSDMVTGDISFDFGFATLSSTSSYFETDGETFYDGTWGTLALPAAYLPYYTGTPVYPRFTSLQRFTDRTKAFSQEARLISKSGGAVDYILGLFYQHERQYSAWESFDPGQTAYNALPGVTPGGPTLPDDQIWSNSGTSTFTDKAAFGELTWHVNDRLDLAGGVRVFRQSFRRNAANLSPVVFIAEFDQSRATFSDAKFRFNATYEYADDHRGYFTFSQGFRRGGANTFSTTGFLREPQSIRTYRPDSVDNFEVGLKGRFAGGWRYTADVFLAKWHDAQIGGFTAVNFWPVVFNAGAAESKGFEVEVNGRLGSKLDLSAGYSFTDAKLTEDFCLPSGDGTGNPTGDIPCAIVGAKGTTLPSAPRHSGTFTLTYTTPVAEKTSLNASLNGNYKSSTKQILPTVGQRYPTIPSYWLFNGYVGIDRGPVTIAAFVRNIFDKRVVYAVNTRITDYAPIDVYETVGRPRTAGAELTFRF